MKHSYYDGPPERIIPRRASGYQKGQDGYSNATHVSMTQFHAAGALASTVDDLALWDASLYTERLLKQETLQHAFSPCKLVDGSPADYGYSCILNDYEGCQMIEHAGAIDGFITESFQIPEERVFLAILSNNDQRESTEAKAVLPEQLAFEMAALAIGKPYKMPTVIEVQSDLLLSYEGVYEFSQGTENVITCENGQLYVQGTGGERIELLPISPDEFMFKGKASVYRLRLIKSAEEVLIAIEVSRLGRSRREVAKKTDKPLPGLT